MSFLKPSYAIAWLIGVCAGIAANLIAKGLPLSFSGVAQAFDLNIVALSLSGAIGGLIAIMVISKVGLG